MKKLLLLILAACMLLSLWGCGKDEDPKNTEDKGGVGAPSTQETEKKPVNIGYVFTYKGAELTPGIQFQSDALPEPEYQYTAPNCALPGNDTVYNYVDIEVAVYSDGKSDIIQSVYIINPNLTTPEGLALGDDLAKVKQLYGENFTQNAAEWQFAKGDMILSILTQDDFVASIEYRLAG